MADQRIAGLAERLLGDERLRADLPDRAAAALTRWGLQQLNALAPAADDAALERRYAEVRSALLGAAQSGLTAPKRLVAHAAALLGTAAQPPPPATPPALERRRRAGSADPRAGRRAGPDRPRWRGCP